jgi:hypothetical protein
MRRTIYQDKKFNSKQPLKSININCLNKLFTYLWMSLAFPKKDIPSYHKHVSNEKNIIPASIPDLEDVLKEVIMYLS